MMKRMLVCLLTLCLLGAQLPVLAQESTVFTIATPLFPAFFDTEKQAQLEALLGVSFRILDIGWEQYEYQRNLLLTSSETPDLFSVADLSDEVLQSAATITEEELRTYMPDVYQGLLERAQVSGVSADKVLRSWGIGGEMKCFSPGKVQDTLPRGIIIRTDVLKALGFDMPQSISDWNRLLLAYKAAHPETYPIACIGGSETGAFAMFLSSYGIIRDEWLYQSGLLQYAPFMLGMRDSLKQLSQWYRDGLIDPLYFEMYARANYEQEVFASGGTFFLTDVPLDTDITPPFEEGSLLAQLASNDPGATFAWAPYPFFDSQGHVTVANKFSLSGPYLCFGGHLQENPERKHLLMRCLNLLLSDPQAYMLYRTGVDSRAAEGSLLSLYNDGTGWSYLEPVPSLCRHMLPKESLATLDQLLRGEESLYGRGSLNYMDSPKIIGAFANAAGVNFSVKNETYLTQWNSFFTSIVIGLNTLESFDSFILTWKRSVGFDMMETANALYLRHWIR